MNLKFCDASFLVVGSDSLGYVGKYQGFVVETGRPTLVIMGFTLPLPKSWQFLDNLAIPYRGTGGTTEDTEDTELWPLPPSACVR
jgi:hypothetical protein